MTERWDSNPRYGKTVNRISNPKSHNNQRIKPTIPNSRISDLADFEDMIRGRTDHLVLAPDPFGQLANLNLLRGKHAQALRGSELIKVRKLSHDY